ncbi:MAG: hypothetical protein LBT09_16175 [Planctomycetaceae bacterium]|jgi:hypothetical protein|nr:hypothetical protein [Planctomycetaceae bacterium]
MLDLKSHIRADKYGASIEWDDANLHCVVKVGYNDGLRVLCYDESLPFDSLSESELHTIGRDFEHPQIGYEQFLRAGVLSKDNDMAEGDFATCPEAWISGKVMTRLLRAWDDYRQNGVYAGICDLFNQYVTGGWTLVSECMELPNTPVTNTHFRVKFADGLQLRWYQYSAFEKFDDAIQYCKDANAKAGKPITVIYKGLPKVNKAMTYAELLEKYRDTGLLIFSVDDSREVVVNRLYQSAMYHRIIDRNLSRSKVLDVLIIPRLDRNSVD